MYRDASTAITSTAAHLGRISRFIVSGGLATALHYLVMALLLSLGSPASAGTAAGAAAGAVANYVLQYRYTFRARTSHRVAGRRYVAVVAAGWLLNLMFFAALHAGLSLNTWMAQGIATLLLAWINYRVFQRCVFL